MSDVPEIHGKSAESSPSGSSEDPSLSSLEKKRKKPISSSKSN